MEKAYWYHSINLKYYRVSLFPKPVILSARSFIISSTVKKVVIDVIKKKLLWLNRYAVLDIVVVLK